MMLFDAVRCCSESTRYDWSLSTAMRQNPPVALDDLLADLEAEFAAEQARAFEGEVTELARAEQAGADLAARLRAGIGGAVTAATADGTTWRGVLVSTGPDWLLVRVDAGAEVLLATAALSWVEGLPRRPAPADASTRRAARIGLPIVLRRLARDRGSVQVYLQDRMNLVGTLERTGADFVELVVHAAGEDVRSGTGVRVLPLAALVAVRLR
jgi:hypothetical protein